MWLTLLTMLGIYSYWDIKSRKLEVRWIFAGFLLAVSCRILFRGEEELLWILAGVLPGMFLTGIAAAAKGKVGLGDGLILMIIGMMTDVKSCLCICAAAVMLAFVYSCIRLSFGGRMRDVFPFVPFYFMGTVLTGVMRSVG